MLKVDSNLDSAVDSIWNDWWAQKWIQKWTQITMQNNNAKKIENLNNCSTQNCAHQFDNFARIAQNANTCAKY